MKRERQEATVHSIVKKLKAAYHTAEWARANGFDFVEIMWVYETAIEEVIEGTPLVGESQRR